MAIGRTLVFSVLMAAGLGGGAGPALAQSCTRAGVDVTCDDGRRGVLSGDAIIWADGTRSSLTSPHPSVIIGNKSSVVVGQGVFVGQGKGVVPMENPSDPTPGALPGARWRAVLLLRAPGRPGIRRWGDAHRKLNSSLIASVIWVVQPPAQKIFRLTRRANQLLPTRPVSPDKRGGSRSSRTRGRDAVDAGCATLVARTTNGADADGEVVWSWRPDAGVKFRGGIRSGDGGKKARSPRRARSKP